MTISYKWLSEYLPVTVPVERLSHILTAIGLEVESTEVYEEYKGGLKGLLVGEVISCSPHPNADKLKLTTVNIGNKEPLHIVCGAPNVAVGQKVIVAPVGATIYPINHEPLTMKLAKIRGEESQGMICAEDEIGLGELHDGILVLHADATPGIPATDYYDAYTDTIFEIGLTPNRMDAMSHWGVARDVCAYLWHHDNKMAKPVLPEINNFKAPKGEKPIQLTVENSIACPRYSGICINNITIGPSPIWLQQKLKAIGLRPINNIVDITNFIQHETGQPLHAFDADTIAGYTIIVKNLPEGTPFITLDGKERKLHAEDLMICDANEGMCIGGVLGGLHSGVTATTKNIFLESAFFDPITIRKTSFRHALRTDAATRFEKGTDISATVTVLKRAAMLILNECGGELASDIYDHYPEPKLPVTVVLKNHYLKKLSGKNYHPDAVKNILQALGFIIEKEAADSLAVIVPYHKPDISLPADIVEEIVRIDGLDNIDFPASTQITYSHREDSDNELIKEKIASYLVGLGFNEILTNSITNKAYFTDGEMANVVKMKNSLSAALNIMRPNMLETGLEILHYNINRKNTNLALYEFGRTYAVNAKGKFDEPEHLCLYMTGLNTQPAWKYKAIPNDFYIIKGVIEKIVSFAGIDVIQYDEAFPKQYEYGLTIKIGQQVLGHFGLVNKKIQTRFDIKQPVFFADLQWDIIIKNAKKYKPIYTPLLKFPAVQRDLAMVVPANIPYSSIEAAIKKLNLKKLQSQQLFDVFESDKLGKGKKSLAINFTFLDEEKTLTDVEIDSWMQQIIQSLEKDLHVEIRK